MRCSGFVDEEERLVWLGSEFLMEECMENMDCKIKAGIIVGKSKKDKYAISWALDHFGAQDDTFILFFVRDPILAVPTPMGNYIPIEKVRKEVADAYLRHMDQVAENLLIPLKRLCIYRKVQPQVQIIEDINPTNAIVQEVLRYGLQKLVVGSPCKGSISRMMANPDGGEYLVKNVPVYCHVYVMSKGKIVRKSCPTNFKQLERDVSTDLESSGSGSGSFKGHSPHSPEIWRSAKSPRGHVWRRAFSFGGNIEHEAIVNSKEQHCSRDNKADTKLSSVKENDYQDHSEANSLIESSDIIEKEIIQAKNQDSVDIAMVPISRSNSISDSSKFYKIQPLIIPNSSQCENKETSVSNSSPTGSVSFKDIGLDDANAPKSEVTNDGSSSPEFQTNKVGIMRLMVSVEERLKFSDPQAGVEIELQNLKDELIRIRQSYNVVYEEAITAKRKVQELQLEKAEEAKRLEEAKAKEELALAMVAEEKARHEAAMMEVEAAKQLAEIEVQLRKSTNTKDRDYKSRTQVAPTLEDSRYRIYTVEEIDKETDYLSESFKIGEGAFGSVYKCTLHHTQVAIKVLHPDAVQGWNQFKQEVEVLCSIRHPNIVLLLGACPELGCLVYEYMANGSLEDRLFRRGATPPLPWHLRFKIAWEVATALFFLHSHTPEPLVHRDLKPANILLDENFVSKISDVGHARLIPSSASCDITQFRFTSIAGTVCYIDPEYQRTGMLRTKSDTYALGIMLLQLLTARQPDGILYMVERSIEKGSFGSILDPVVKDWPVPQALEMAKMALKCSELSHKDRPDLGTVVLPQLQLLKTYAEDHLRKLKLSKCSKSHFSFKLLPKTFNTS